MIALQRQRRPVALHSVLQSAVLRRLGALPWCVLAPVARGVAHHQGATVRYGWLDGCSDLWGWVTTDAGVARCFGVEIKAGRDAERPNQEQFRRLVNRAGGYACVVRAASTSDIPAAVEEALAHARRAREQQTETHHD